MKSKTTIEVNGKRYDAVTGAVIGVASAPPVRSGQNIDGFFRARPSTVKTLPVAEKITVLAAPAPSEPKPRSQPQRGVNHARAHTPQPAKTVEVRLDKTVHHEQKLTVHRTISAANHTKHHTVQSSETLIRTAVHRPDPSFKKQAATKGSLQHSVPSLIVPKQSAIALDTDRLVRAQSTARSPQIAHISGHAAGVATTFVPIAVQAFPDAPDNAPEQTPSPKPTNKPPTDIFEHALANATHFVDIQAHKKHFKKQARVHVASMTAGTLALLLLAGFAAYQNTPGLQFKVASLQAGVSTGMPNLKAAGFAYDGVKAGNGKLTIGFSNISGDYQLIQQDTSWSDSDMIQAVGSADSSGKPNYTAVQAGSTTVYRLANNNATWVSGGKWYTVTGTGALSDQQVQTIVKNV